MKANRIEKKLADLKVEDVMCVYSGKAYHCCCGCAGKYSYSEANRNIGSKDRGYKIEDSEISNIAVKRALNRIQRHPVPTEPSEMDVVFGVNNFSITVGNRVCIVYPIPSIVVVSR